MTERQAVLFDALKPQSELILGELTPYIRVERKKNAKRLALRLDSKDRIVRFVIPQNVSTRKAQEFLDLNGEWVLNRLDELPKAVPYQNGTILPILGQDIRVRISLDKTLKRTSIALKNNELLVLTNKDDPSSRINRYLKNLAKTHISEHANIKAETIHKTIHSVQIRDTKSRWGSCSHDGKLSFSWRLIFAPPASCDYVIAHEVAHLVHMDHSRNFWKQCEELCENYKAGKTWMRTNGHTLMRYGMNDNV